MVTKNELEHQKQMNKALKDVENKWEMIAFIWAYRRREILAIICLIQLCIIIVLLGKYTQAFETIGKYILSFFGGK